MPRAAEPQLATRDFFINDDVVAVGAGCLGSDCVNNEVFGFENLLLKQNNNRIRMDDTSAAVGFPANDWQLRINDDSSGGLNRFSIEDLTAARIPFTILAGAPNDSLVVTATGNVGLGTMAPATELHIVDGDTPTVRLEQDGSSGFTAHTWDVAGNESNFIVRDVTGGNTVPVRIRPGAPSDSIHIATGGNVGIGQSTPTDRLHILGAATGGLLIQQTGAGLPQFTLQKDGAPARTWRVRVNTPGNFVFTDATSGVAPFRIVPNAGNDRLVITTTGVDITGTLRVNGVTMTVPDYVFEPEYELMPLDEVAAFIAANKHLPEVPNATDIQENGLDLSAFPLTLLKKVEELTLYTLEQHRTLAAQREEISRLRNGNAELEQRLAALERRLSATKPD